MFVDRVSLTRLQELSLGESFLEQVSGVLWDQVIFR